MFEAASVVRNPKRLQRARSKFLPAPVGGWNARDSLLEMDPKDAVILDNFFPRATDVQLRYGYSNWVTGISGTVETLMPHTSISGTRKLFAAAGTAIYDATSSGAVGAAVQSGLSNARWQYINFNATGTELLYMVNGADAERYYDGSSWTTPSLSGISAGDAIGIQSHGQRIFFILKNSLKVAYLPIAAVSGTLSFLDLGQVFKWGGYIMAMESWSADTGAGQSYYATFITSEGEFVIYAGNDPSLSSTWAKVAQGRIGSPMGRRCFSPYGTDLLVVNRDGLLPFSQAIITSRISSKSALTDKIQRAISDATSLYASNYGWDIQGFPNQNQLYLNVPIGGGLAYQYVMNTITGAWCRFTGWNASCWELFGDQVYFGTSGAVCKAWDTNADNSTNINTDALQAFNSFGTDQIKQITMAKPILTTNGNPGLVLGINVDGDTTAPTGTPSFSPTSAGVWGSATWGTSLWGSQGSISKNWQGAQGIGLVAALHMKSASQGITMNWIGTDYAYNVGGLA